MYPYQPSKKFVAIWLVATLIGGAFLAALRGKNTAIAASEPALLDGQFSAGAGDGAGALDTGPANPSLPYKIFLPAIMKILPDYLIIGRSRLLTLSITSPAWNELKAAADSDPGSSDLCDQNIRIHPKVTLASALVYARTGNQVYADRARSLILAAYPTQIDGCNNAVLSLGRQLGAYVMAADLIGLKDPGFTAWLAAVRTKNIGGHDRWYSLRVTTYDSASNWGIFALASTIAADRFLGDKAALEIDWQVFSAYGVPHGWPFKKTTSYSEDWSCVSTDNSGQLPVAINTPCIKGGYNLDGAPVEDSSRTTFPALGNYPAEAAQGLVVQALLLEQAGYPAWTVNDSQIKRMAEFRGRFDKLNSSSADYYVTWMTNKVYGLSQPTQPAGFGRIFGFTDWLFAP